MLPELENRIFDSSVYEFKQLVKVKPHQICEWEEKDVLSFFNINSKAELQTAACQLLKNHASFWQAVNHDCHSVPKI
ncbi:MAG: hypothetical protein CMP91_06900 [Gammaproteobacteria bacterium]|nr:hypothetical protein [Gammaproteobacteria bacterium]MAY01405.1 hypothetical protein [Gammaproteobacteria bacterium]